MHFKVTIFFALGSAKNFLNSKGMLQSNIINLLTSVSVLYMCLPYSIRKFVLRISYSK